MSHDSHVGSLIRPDALIAARQAAERHELAAPDLRRIQEEAIRDVVRLQEDIGLRVATDGEFNRGSWQRDFLLKLENVALIPSRLSVRFPMVDHPSASRAEAALIAIHGLEGNDNAQPHPRWPGFRVSPPEPANRPHNAPLS